MVLPDGPATRGGALRDGYTGLGSASNIDPPVGRHNRPADQWEDHAKL